MKLHQHLSQPYLTLSFLALVFWLPLPLGSNRDWAWSIMELWVFTMAIIVTVLIYQGKISIPAAFRTAKPILLLLLLYLIWICLQLLPLPMSWLELIAPYSASLAGSLGRNDYAMISLDYDSTLKYLLKSFAYVSIFVLMLLLINNQSKLKWFAYTVILSALFQASYGSFMVLTGIEYSFFFEKSSYIGSATGTFINRNHFAGYLEMALAIGIGLMISKLHSDAAHHWRDRLRMVLHFFLSPKVLIRLSLVISCIGLILSHSRMGNSAFFASLLIAGVLFLLVSKHATRSTSLFLTSLIIIDIILIGSWVGINKVVERIEGTSIQAEQRDEVARDTLTLISKQPVSGYGAGTYAMIFPTFQQPDIQQSYYHAHNDYLEFSAELGLIGITLLALALLYALILALKAMQQRKSVLHLGMAFAGFMGLLSILIHSFVDFNLQIPANTAMFLMLMALTVISASKHNKRVI